MCANSLRLGILGMVLAPAFLMLTVNAVGAPRMRSPMTYVINYSTRYLDNDANISAFRDAPPDLMHVGKSVPILHNWGPVPLISGENQYTGGPKHTLSWDAIRLLTPQELQKRIERLKRYTKKWHDAGVPRVMPYSSFHTIAGDHEKRQGFWNFYDHWRDYAQWLGPKPKEDPFGWLMVDKKGKFVPGACGGYSPAYFAPLHRYRVCPEHPVWQKFQIRLTELIAEVGYDGVFPDNSSVANVCFCRCCREGLKKFARGLSARELAVLGVKRDPARVDLLAADTPAELIRRYRIDTVARYQRMVRDAGRKVNPNFQVFPNVNSYTTFMPISFSCDYLMFESTYSPGCNFTGEPPTLPFVCIEVGPGAASAHRDKFELAVQNRETFVELSASIEFPKRIKLGGSGEFVVRVETVGASNRDSDWAEDFALVLVDTANGQDTRLPLTPATTIGGGRMRPKAKRPPVELHARWTPSRAGAYKLCFAYAYTDEGHTDVARGLACRHDLDLGLMYQTHIGQLLFTMHAGARTVLLDYQCGRRGKENVQELGLAECAAFSSGSTIASRGKPREKYAKFFRRAKRLYEGFEPYADIGLLYSYWGYNPGGLGLRASQGISPSVDLAGRHRPIKVLMDRTIGEADLRTLKTLILCGHALEMTDAQIAAIKAFVRQGGALYVYRPDTKVNGGPLAALGHVQQWQRGAEVPGMAALIEGKGLARGLRFSAFVKPDERRMALHAVNYNVAHRERPAKAAKVRDVAVTLPLPAGWAVRAVRAYDPDRERVVEMKFDIQEGRLKFSLPTVRIYRVIEIAAE